MIRAAGPAVDVVRRHYVMDHLHESGWSMDFPSNSCLFHGIIRYDFVAVCDVCATSNICRPTFVRVVLIEDFTP